jgi:1,4-alpha-glucan branching enzyme
MITKTPSKRNGSTTKVTFELPQESAGEQVSLCGEFNEWAPERTPMTKRKGGRFSVTLTLEGGRSYRFRYLVDGHRWENDPAADGYIPNEYGSEDSVITT